MDDGPFQRFELKLPFDEFRVWGQRVRPTLEQAGVEDACLSVLEYVCTEMLNNVLDHSRASQTTVAFAWNARSVVVHIDDDGQGVFGALREAFTLESDIDAALLLVKGKVTTDPQRHTGEGLFFSARACEWFYLQSHATAISLKGGGAWDLLSKPNEDVAGTRLRFRVARRDPPILREVFDRYCPQPELRFTRTDVGVGLLRQADGALVSRSQGKRLVMGLDRFDRVHFDFAGVDEMQQGFADEVFRVWRGQHPSIEVTVGDAGPDVVRMLRHVGFDPGREPAAGA